MIAEMITSAYLNYSSPGTRGNSESAHFLARQIEDLRQKDLLLPDFYFSLLKRTLPELTELIKNSSHPGWDGYNALPVSSQAYNVTLEFLRALPNTLPIPSVGADPDGHVTLEWYNNPHRTLSISVSPEGELHYAALLGPNKAYGTEIFYGSAPENIVELIQRVYGV